MPFEKGNKYRFTKDRQPTRRSGPVKLCSQIGSIPKDAQQRLYEVLHTAISLNSKEEALKYLKEEKDKGQYGFVLELAIANLASKNGWQTFNDIMDRLFGKPKQVNENYNENNDTSKAVVIFADEEEEDDSPN